MSPVWLALLRLLYAVTVIGGAVWIAGRFPPHADAAIVMALSALASLVAEVRGDRLRAQGADEPPAGHALIEESRTRYYTPRGVPILREPAESQEPTQPDSPRRDEDGWGSVLAALAACAALAFALLCLSYGFGRWLAMRGNP